MTHSEHSQAVRPQDIAPVQRGCLRSYRSWRRFHNGPRQAPQPLLHALPAYRDCVLVAGCQRSGTTMLTRIIANSRGFRPLQLTVDDELDAALALSGHIELPTGTRYCLQTTYLNERFREYAQLGPAQRLIWVLRNPHSVVYSMVYNWRRWALNELYESCRDEASARTVEMARAEFGGFFARRLHKACVAYVGKTTQILAIRDLVPPAQLLVIDYDELVREPDKWLPRIFAFAGEPFQAGYASAIRADSTHKADRMSAHSRQLVEKHALPAYQICLRLTQDSGHES